MKDALSRYVDTARRGERVRILVRGIPAADLVPVGDGGAAKGAEDAEIAALERQGIVRRGRGGVPTEILRPGPRVRGGRAVETLIAERRRGR